MVTIFIEKNDERKDKMSQIINDIRTLMTSSNLQQLNINEIMRRLEKTNPSRYNSREFKKDNVLETLNFYKNLSVVYVDNEENVIFL